MNKPKFDPNKPFEVADQKAAVQVAGSEKPKFDPSKPFEQVVDESGKSAAQAAQKYDYSNIPQVAKDIGAQAVKGLKEIPEMALSTIGYEAAGPAGSGAGAVAGRAITEAAEGLVSAVKDPEQFVKDLGRLPTKEQVIDQVNKYLNTFSLNVAAPAVVQKIAGKIGAAPSAIREGAEHMAEKATGATGVQASKFKPQAGRELLDRKLVQFGDTPAKVAERTQKAVDVAESNIDDVLTKLDQKGVKVSVQNVINNIESKISSMGKDPSQADIVKRLQGIVENIKATGEDFVNPSMGEKTKRGFNRIAGNWLDPEKGQAGKIAYQAYRNEVEKTAVKEAPELAKLFQESKKSYGLLKPIQEAAERRAQTLKQSPLGGLLDVAAAGGAGASIGGVEGLLTGVAVAGARRAVAPRLASSAAVTLDSVAKSLSKVPEYASLAEKNPQAFGALVNAVFGSFKEEPQKKSEKWEQKGYEKLKEYGLKEDQLNSLLNSKNGKDLVSEASGLDINSKAFEKLTGRIEDKLKKEQEIKPKMKFPIIVRKNGQKAVIKNQSELDEARAEGWR